MNISAIVTDSRKLTYILGAAIALMVFFAFIFIITSSFGGRQTEKAEITVWGVFDDFTAFTAALNAFEKENKDIAITYEMFKVQDYEPMLLNALAAGEGPDVFMIHHTWLPKHISKMQPMPDTIPGQKVPLMTVRQFQDTFVDVAATDLINDGKIYGMPLYMDTLALYYNKDMFATAGIPQPPKLWTDFMEDVEKITTYDESRNITRSAAALGTARNINRSTDILMMLMLQSGVQMTADDNTSATFSRSVDGVDVGQRSLTFYTDFANTQRAVYTWNGAMDYSIDAFVGGKTAMMMNYAHQIPVLRAAAPRLNWSIAPIPQVSAVDIRTYANYWPLVVSRQTDAPNASWKFIHYMAAGNGTVPFLNATGRPSARRDLIEEQKLDKDLGVFAEQALAARSWFQIDNVAIETIFADMIDNVNYGKQELTEALQSAEAKISVLMSGR
jgi:multiple sugar transport system substrate-binding protein